MAVACISTLSTEDGATGGWKYRYAGREGLPPSGTFPEVSLVEARHRRDEARALLRDEKDPGEVRKTAKLASLQNKEAAFPVAAEAWLEFNAQGLGAGQVINKREIRHGHVFNSRLRALLHHYIEYEAGGGCFREDGS